MVLLLLSGMVGRSLRTRKQII